MAKLTKRTIEALEPADKDYFVWDGELSGLGIRVFPTGRKQFVLQYRWTNLEANVPRTLRCDHT